MTTSSRSAAAAFQQTVRRQLSNGITVLLLRNPSSPSISLRGEIGVGSANESPARAGTAGFTASALQRGTQQRTFQQISEEAEDRGATLSFSGGTHSSSFGAKMLSEDFDFMLELLVDVLLHPTFPEDEIAKLRGQLIVGLREEQQQTMARAMRLSRALLYPPEHPYSRPVSGSLDTVESLTRDDLVAFHSLYHPALTTISVVGDIEPEAVIADLERILGSWQGNGAPAVQALPELQPLQGIQREEAIVSNAVQSDVRWAVRGVTRNDPRYYAANVGNHILGRMGLGGRMGENIRQRQGMAYYAYSTLDADIDAGPWSAFAGVSPQNIERALEGIRHEIQSFCETGPTDEELSDARSNLSGNLMLSMETNEGIANALLSIERFGLGLDYIARYPDILAGITRDQILDVARTCLSVENSVIAVARPAS